MCQSDENTQSVVNVLIERYPYKRKYNFCECSYGRIFYNEISNFCESEGGEEGGSVYLNRQDFCR